MLFDMLCLIVSITSSDLCVDCVLLLLLQLSLVLQPPTPECECLGQLPAMTAGCALGLENFNINLIQRTIMAVKGVWDWWRRQENFICCQLLQAAAPPPHDPLSARGS